MSRYKVNSINSPLKSIDNSNSEKSVNSCDSHYEDLNVSGLKKVASMPNLESTFYSPPKIASRLSSSSSSSRKIESNDRAFFTSINMRNIKPVSTSNLLKMSPSPVKDKKLAIRNTILKNQSTERLLRERDQYISKELLKKALKRKNSHDDAAVIKE